MWPVMLFCGGCLSYVSFTTGWEVSLVGRNTITHGGCAGPATQKVTFNCQNLRTFGVTVRFAVRYSVFGVWSWTGSRVSTSYLDSLTNFEYLAQSSIRSCSIPVRCRAGSRYPDVLLACCRRSDALSLLQCRRCSLSLFAVRLFSCSISSSASLPRTFRTLFHTKCTVWNRDANWTRCLYLYDFWRVGDRPPVQAA